MKEKKLRIAHLTIQPVLVWDDGEDLTPAEQIEPIQIPVSKFNDFVEKLKKDIPLLEQQLIENEETEGVKEDEGN